MKDQKYTVEAIVKSKRFSGYQPDFVKAILKDGEYTISEAEKKIQKYFEREGKK